MPVHEKERKLYELFKYFSTMMNNTPTKRTATAVVVVVVVAAVVGGIFVLTCKNVISTLQLKGHLSYRRHSTRILTCTYKYSFLLILAAKRLGKGGKKKNDKQ